jgi:hypothetical protein
MAKIRESTSAFERAGIRKEQVQEWLTDPCTMHVVGRLREALTEQREVILRVVKNGSTSTDIAAEIRALGAQLIALESIEGIFTEADRYASDK